MGTNLDVCTRLWLVCSGGLLHPRGAGSPGRIALGLAVAAGQRTWAAGQRTWAALSHGAWTSAPLLGGWVAIVGDEGRGQPPPDAGEHPVAVEVTGGNRG